MADKLVDFGLDAWVLQQLAESSRPRAQLGRVTEVQRSELRVMTDEGERRVSLAMELLRSDLIDRPTVGDWVVLNERRDTVEQVLDRRSLFKRAAAGRGDEIQPIAANVDTVFVVSSCNDEFKEARIERYLALCHEAGVVPVLVLSKADLSDDPLAYEERARKLHSQLAVEVVNATDPEDLAGLEAWIRPRSTVALVGSSGVGKSTLLNALAGKEMAATQGIREQDARGRHTTTHRALYRLPGGGLLIDVPGMRELRVTDVDEALGDVFEDIDRLAGRCRFSDCAHASEPGCAIKAAIEDGALDPRRLASYQKLQSENVEATATIAQRRARARGFAKVVAEAKDWKQRSQE
ncbi:MAG: ribosome small subunit-dependent GTPase A [Halieaceae bacterium]|jgi:ribosome biogenesis GTPase|nr:ribosome small subunit-dependent GTPase A [Halieaceae bacterium]